MAVIVSAMKQRLLRDIKEMITNPYPNIELPLASAMGDTDTDLSSTCVVITPEGWPSMHLTAHFPVGYPIEPMSLEMDSRVHHSNVYGSYICATVLRKTEDYTPAYTLRSILIQMLSFFGSDKIEQEHAWDDDDKFTSLEEYRKRTWKAWDSRFNRFKCGKCGYPNSTTREKNAAGEIIPSSDSSATAVEEQVSGLALSNDGKLQQMGVKGSEVPITVLPAEILLNILDSLQDEDLFNFARAWPRVSGIIASHDVMRRRELHCFVLKTSFTTSDLGIGVERDGKSLSSEFELLSSSAFIECGQRVSIHGAKFSFWLPLPLAHAHWCRVMSRASTTLKTLGHAMRIQDQGFGMEISVILAFMSDIVVRLNNFDETCSIKQRNSAGVTTLKHASERAIESYFQLYHLLLCFAVESRTNVSAVADAKIQAFYEGKRHKTDVPNLGHMILYFLLTSMPPNMALQQAVVTEAVTRNVVWMLDPRHGDMPEMAYLETDKVSHYRLQKIFHAGKTGYRLLMFADLFRRLVRPDFSVPLAALNDELFARHGAPPPGMARKIAAEVRRLHGIDRFSDFIDEVRAGNPGPEFFTGLLRRTVEDSMDKGYSRRALTQPQALRLRLEVERTVGVQRELKPLLRSLPSADVGRLTFFPQRGGGFGGRGRGRGCQRGRGGGGRGSRSRGGRGRGRGAY